MSDTKESIEVGDTVYVRVCDDPTVNFVGKVLYTPVATGDCWRIKDQQHGDIVYLQSFLFMLLRTKRTSAGGSE
jgi:hypothetical protein